MFCDYLSYPICDFCISVIVHEHVLNLILVCHDISYCYYYCYERLKFQIFRTVVALLSGATRMALINRPDAR